MNLKKSNLHGIISHRQTQINVQITTRDTFHQLGESSLERKQPNPHERWCWEQNLAKSTTGLLALSMTLLYISSPLFFYDVINPLFFSCNTTNPLITSTPSFTLASFSFSSRINFLSLSAFSLHIAAPTTAPLNLAMGQNPGASS